MPKQDTRDVLAGALNLHGAYLVRDSGHSVDDRGFLVLAYSVGTLLAHGKKSLSSVLSHAGHYYADHLAVDHLRH